MTRGKYAARAANARAERSQGTAEQLREQLEADHRTHTEEVRELKSQIELLAGQLTCAVADLADKRVADAEAAAAEQLRAVQTDHERLLLEMFAMFGSRLENGRDDPRTYTAAELSDVYADLILLFGLDPGAAWQALASTSHWNLVRAKRRESKADTNIIRKGERRVVIKAPR